MFQFDQTQYESRTKWYKEARFGMFIHYGLYSICARGEWVRSDEQMTKEDYPHFQDNFHPMRNHPECSNEHRNFNRYLDFMHGQVRELCSNYGKLDILWFDFSYGKLKGDAWRAKELIAMVRSLQPDVVIDNRLESASGMGYGSLFECRPTAYHGDFVTPEQIIPPQGIRDIRGNPMVWEACVTMNNHWGYFEQDKQFKPASMLIKKLVECVSKGGNMLLNVGPKGSGAFCEDSIRILEAIGKWMKINAQSVIGCTASVYDKPENGRYTQNGNILYFHIFENTIGPMPLPGLRKEDIASITMLESGKEISISSSWLCADHPDICFMDLGTDPLLPDQTDTVVKITLKKEGERL